MISRKLQTLPNRLERGNEKSFTETPRICFNKRAMNHSHIVVLLYFLMQHIKIYTYKTYNLVGKSCIAIPQKSYTCG